VLTLKRRTVGMMAIGSGWEMSWLFSTTGPGASLPANARHGMPQALSHSSEKRERGATLARQLNCSRPFHSKKCPFETIPDHPTCPSRSYDGV